MTTALQAQSNARNAQLSTGPTSAEGKARVARNAVKHGFCAADILMPGDDDAAFAGLLQRERDLWQPVDDKEAELVDEIAVCTWRRWRLRRAESQLWAKRCGGTGDDSERLANLGEAIADDCDSAANAIEKVRRWWQGNERHLRRCEEQLRLRKRIAGHSEAMRNLAMRHPGFDRYVDAVVNRPLPGITAASVENEIRQWEKQSQLHEPQPEQAAAEEIAADPVPVNHDLPDTSPAPLATARNRKERRRLERQLRRAEKQAAQR